MRAAGARNFFEGLKKANNGITTEESEKKLSDLYRSTNYKK